MKQIHSLLCLLLLVVSFTACESNDDSNSNSQNDDTFAQNFGNSVSKDFIGQVVDTDNHPIQNAEIKIGTSTVQTDINGVFIINGADVHEKFAYITATKAGYIDGSRSMVPTSGKNNVKIMLIPNTPLQTIQSGVASEVSLPSGTKVNFDGEFQDENGNAYSGTVSVAMFHLLPSDENIDKLMPGMLYAQTKTNQEAVLETFGMLNVELRGSAGQKLNIKEGHTAEITLKIDDSQTATAPNSIPLWHFDEAKGYWKEDGVATKVGNKYVGEVSHFSWWNCDMPFPAVTLTINLTDNEGNPLSNTLVELVSTNNGHALGFTDNNGQSTGMVSANQTFVINIYDSCGICYTANLGPFISDTILPTITLNPTTLTSKIKGKFVKCDNSDVANGYVMLKYRDKISFSALDEGNFNFSVLVCGDSDVFEITGYDVDNQQTTGAISYGFNFPETTVGELKSCNTLNEFVICKIDDSPSRLFTSPFTTDIIHNGTSTGLDILYYQNDGVFSISWFNATFLVGTYSENNFQMQTSYEGLPPNLPSYILRTNSTIVYKVNKFGAVGDYIDITFEGTYTGPGTHTIKGTVHVLRDE